MSHKLQALIAGNSRITEKTDADGRPVLILKTVEHTPRRLKTAHGAIFITRLLMTAFFGYIVFFVELENVSPVDERNAVIGCFLNWLLALWAAPALWLGPLKKRAVIELGPDYIRFEGEKGLTTLSRMQKHKFLARPHDKAPQEQRLNDHIKELARRKGKTITRAPLYGESYHIVLNHMGQRNDLLEIYGKTASRDVVSALTLCDEYLNTVLDMGDGAKLDKDDEWHDSPGGL